eukprot:TRINITY_DN16545_c0_g1_i3.p1 TRINITY_DN16545_c0_g1~~TRINITY_DN16545_c0_g1_i3.p1  ORF type:complete len:369 (+),score=104.23 TRINITY_DN16545_c0_g1_i3:148-1254(+)
MCIRDRYQRRVRGSFCWAMTTRPSDEYEQGKRRATDYVEAEPEVTVEGSAVETGSGDPNGEHKFVMPADHKERLDSIFTQIASITGSQHASWSAVRAMNEAAKESSEYTKIVANKRGNVPAGIPMPFSLDDMTMDAAFSNTPADRKRVQQEQELSRDDFHSRVNAFATDQHANADGTDVLKAIEKKYSLLLKYAPLTDEEEERACSIFIAVDADGDKVIEIAELDFLSGIKDSPFTKDFLVAESKEKMTFPGFAAFLTSVKHRQATAWNGGMLANMETAIKANPAALQRFNQYKDTWFSGDFKKWLERTKGWRPRFNGYEEAPVVGDLRESEGREKPCEHNHEPRSPAGDKGQSPRESACACTGCVVC